jgi:UDP-N-acetylmuramoylalanine--D-glutamate ligase
MYTQKNIMIAGASRAGALAAQFVASRGANVIVCDSGANLNLARRSLASYPIRFEEGFRPDIAQAADLVIVSPEVPWKETSIRAAAQASREVISCAELAFRHLKAPLLAVCGVRGITTTAALVGEMLKASGHNVFVGNETTLLEGAEQSLHWVVASISAEQLAFAHWFHPRVAGLLSIPTQVEIPNTSIEEHTSLLLRLFARMEPADLAALNLDQDIRSLVPKIPAGRKLYFSASHPQATVRVDQNDLVVFGGQERYPISEIKLKGKDAIQNAMAAVVLARGAGATPEGVRQALQTFTGLPHRLEFVRSIDGVSFINDAKSVTVSMALLSLESIDPKIRVILLLGGADVGGAYKNLSMAVKARCRGVIAFGEARDQISKALQGTTLISPAVDLAAAVRLARVISQQGDVVLLSPACPSEDLMKGFEATGEGFRALVARTS